MLIEEIITEQKGISKHDIESDKDTIKTFGYKTDSRKVYKGKNPAGIPIYNRSITRLHDRDTGDEAVIRRSKRYAGSESEESREKAAYDGPRHMMPKHFRVKEGDSPHPKGSKKYKAHMAAKHANMNERELTKKEEGNAEHNVKKLKPHKKNFTDQYGKDGESVMYAVATKQAKKGNRFNEQKVKTRTEWEKEQYVDPGLIKHDPSGVFIQGARKINPKPAMDTSRTIDLPKHPDTWMTRDPLNVSKPERDPEAMKAFKQTHWKKPPTNDTLTGIKNLYKTDNRWHHFVNTYGPELSKNSKRGGHLLMRLRKYYSGFKQNQGKFT